jgi:hypothetical protein
MLINRRDRLFPGMIILLFMASMVPVTAQRDFRPGYIILNEGDTLKGLILYNALHAWTQCTFKKGQDASSVDYSPGDLRAYRFDDGRYFISREIPADKGQALVFLEYLLKGKASLYYFRDGSDHYYIEKEAGKLVELTEQEKILTDASGNEFIKPAQYEGKLRSLMSDCPEIYPSISQTSLNHSSLIKLGKSYHEKVCPGEACVVFERTRKPLHVRFGVAGGISYNNLRFGAQHVNMVNGEKTAEYGDQLISDYRVGGLGGLRVEFEHLVPVFEHISLITGLEIQNFHQYTLTETGQFDLIRYNGNTIRLAGQPHVVYPKSMQAGINALMVRIPLLINMTFLKGKVRPTLTAGMLNMFTLSQNRSFELDRFVREYGKSIPVYHPGLSVFGGLRYFLPSDHFLFLEAGYEFSQTLHVWPEYRLIINQFNIKAGFSL